MKRYFLALVTALGLVIYAATATVDAGGRLETVRITNLPSSIAGHVLADVIGIHWEARTLPVRYVVNTRSTPDGAVPNPLGAPVLTAAQAGAAFQASLDQWNRIPTSYVELHVAGTIDKAALVGFNMINELSFATATNFAAIASSPSVALIGDSQFDDGDDLDGDGDSDVSAAITTAQDVDSDGDIEFPAGLYPAGTILDNDVQFNTKISNGFRFTLGDAALDTVTRSVDLNTVAVHEFGHSFGLSHVLDNNKSATNGRSVVMFPFIDTGDPAAERYGRDLDSDDVAQASLQYPEGTAVAGPAALQAGDVRFSAAYGLVTGEVRHGVLGQPLAGASVYAINTQTGEFAASAFSGTARLSYNPANGGLFFLPPANGLVDGRFVMALPRGNYVIGVEAVDGTPAAAANISYTTQIGNFYGQQNFNEERWNANKEGELEKRVGDGQIVRLNAGQVLSGINITTSRALNINNFGTRDFVGFTGAVAGTYYAVRIPAAQIVAGAPSQPYLVSMAQFDTVVSDASVVPLFAEAMLVTGTVSADGSQAFPDLANPLAKVSGFVAADNDFAPFFFKNPHDLGARVAQGIADGSITSLFLVLRLPTTTPFPGVSGFPPFIGLDGGGATNDVPIFGLSYTSVNGVTFSRSATFNYRFTLTLGEAVP